MDVPEWRAQERSYELQKARDILRNPSATEEERGYRRSTHQGTPMTQRKSRSDSPQSPGEAFSSYLCGATPIFS
jgi:hypothetical protein